MNERNENTKNVGKSWFLHRKIDNRRENFFQLKQSKASSIFSS